MAEQLRQEKYKTELMAEQLKLLKGQQTQYYQMMDLAKNTIQLQNLQSTLKISPALQGYELVRVQQPGFI